jgi:16S rRNA processing protein RimM
VENQTKNDWVIVGRFGRVHGIKGLIHIQSFTEPSENIFSYEPLYISLKRTWCPIRLLQKQLSGDKLLVQVENYLTREDASFLTNIEIAVPRQVLPKLDDDHYYLHDLIGLSVFNLQNGFLGKITDIMPTGANDVLVVSGDQRTLIPFIWEVYVKQVELASQKMTVDWVLDEMTP